MLEQLINTLVSLFAWQQLAWIVFFYLAAWLVSRLSRRIARRIVSLDRFAHHREQLRDERRATLRGLIASVLNFGAFVTATLLSLSLFVESDTLIWMVGLFSAAFGLGSRPLVSDFLTGISFIFENTFDVGDKVELVGLPGGNQEGLIEAVHLRTSLLRANSGELFTIPNGEIRVVRNFSRGRFSQIRIKFKVPAADLKRTLDRLNQLGDEATALLPNLIEPWQILSESGELGQHTQLTLVAKARFGKAAEMQPRLLSLIQEQLAEVEIQLAD